MNVSDVDSQEELNDRVCVAAFFGTLQAGFTNFHYLRPIWRQTTEKDALLGIGMTGIASGNVLKYNLEEAAHLARMTNIFISGKININEAARITCIKPSGTTSCVLGTSSGIHAWHDPYYLRTVRFGKDEAIAQYLQLVHPELCEDDILRPHDTLCVRIPIKAPEGSIFRNETAIDTLERVKKFSIEWVRKGHVKGDNTHNVSATISIDKERLYKGYKLMTDRDGGKMLGGLIDEWQAVGEWMWENREHYNGLSVLPFFGGTYKQAPFETITEEEYNQRINTLKDINLENVFEADDNVEFGQTNACSGGSCSLE